MNDHDARELVRTVLHEVAPDADLDTVGAEETLQEALDLDSLDFLNFVVGLHKATGVDVPERDYPQLATLEGCVGYLRARADVSDGDDGGDAGDVAGTGAGTSSAVGASGGNDEGDRDGNGRTTWRSS